MQDGASQFPGASNAYDVRLDELLRAAMTARPEPDAPPDLAGSAMKMVRSAERAFSAEQTRRLARQRWWAQVSGLAAAVIIVAMLAGAAQRMWSRGDIAALAVSDSTSVSSTDATADDSTTAVNSSTSTSSTANTVLVVLVAEVLVLAVILLSITRAGPTMPFGAEALAGFW